MWDLPEPTSGKRVRPKKYRDKLSLDSIKDFHGEIKFGKYKVTHRTVKTNLFLEIALCMHMKLYKLCWSIETNYYEQKTFWSIDKYMVRKHIGIERLLNMINIAHSMTKILLYIDNMFYEYRNMSAQEFRHKLNELINKEIFFGSLADCAQTAKNSDIIMEFLAAMGWNQGYAA